jgi:Zn-dependent M28 family amino/carboxypeptidase
MKKAMISFILLIVSFIVVSCSGTFSLDRLDSVEIQKIQSAVDAVDPVAILSTMQALESNRDGGQIITLLQNMGYTPTVVTMNSQDNIVVSLSGTEPALNPVFVQAHYDYEYWPAMEDNGSGVGGVLEIARVINLLGLQFKRNIYFIFFDGEESGKAGSTAYVNTLSGNAIPSFFINFDMIAYTSSAPDSLSIISRQSEGNYINVFGVEWAAECVVEFVRDAKTFVPELRFFATTLPSDYKNSPIINNATRSDNEPFWDRGIHGLFFTTADRDPFYHTNADTLATLNIDFMTQVVKAAFAAVCAKAMIQ